MERVNCFLIDDDPEDIEMFDYALANSQIPYILTTANNGEAAIEKLSEKSFIPDFIFLDSKMPGMQGIDCLVAIRKMPWLNDTRIIMCSSTLYRLQDEDVLKSNATHFLVKPVDLDKLAKSLAAIFTDSSSSKLPFVL